MQFDLYIGIDYSGAQTPTSRMPGLQVYATDQRGMTEPVVSPSVPTGKKWNWTRREIAEWLITQIEDGQRIMVGIDHAFSFPESYLKRYRLRDWDAFLDDFYRHWPTDQDHVYVEFFRENNPRTGKPNEFRLTEKWTSSAKSVFRFDVQGSVAKSSHAGIPWLYLIRKQLGSRVHLWPFDGWSIPKGKSVIAEVYPSIFSSRYPRESRTADQQDAYAVSRWLYESDMRGILPRYCDPPLAIDERLLAEREGWILGVF